jgi:hypothetical protein
MPRQKGKREQMTNGERREFRASRIRVQHGILLGAVLALIGLGTVLFAGTAVRDAELVGGVVLAQIGRAHV